MFRRGYWRKSGKSHSSFVEGGALLNRERYSEIHEELYKRVESLGYECAGFEIVTEAGMNILRLYLEMPGGVNIDDCERVSHAVSDYLDTIEDELPDKYFLEISSPGVERPLFSIRDYRRFEGKDVQIYMRNGRNFKGVLAGTEGESGVMVKCGGVLRTVSLDDVKRAHLVYVPPKGQKKTFKKIPKKKK